METSNVNVRIGGLLKAHLQARIGATGSYENASEYIRDLIRRDLESKRDAWQQLGEQLAPAINASPTEYQSVSAEDVIRRNRNHEA